MGGERHARVPHGTDDGRGVTARRRRRSPTNPSTCSSHLIRNECVNDGTPESGFEIAQRRRARAVPRRHRPRPRALRGAARTREPRRAHRRQRPDRADAAADGPHRRRAGEPRRLAARSVRRRDHRRRGLGPRRGRHAEPHRDDGGRVPRSSRVPASRRAARSSTSRSPTRRTSARGAPSTCCEHERDAVQADYVVTEAGGFQMPTPQGPRLPVIVGEKGSYWCRITVRGTPGHASQPFRTDNALVTAAEIVRRLAEYRPPTMIHDTWRRFIEGVDFGPEWNAQLARRGHAARLLRGAADRARPPGARVHAHDVRADDHPRRHQDQRDSRPRRDRGRHPHAARPARRPTSARCSPTRSAISRAHVEITPFDENESTSSPTDTPMWDAMGRVSSHAGRGLGAGAVPHRRRHRRAVLPARRARSRTASACSAASSRSTTTRRCSTATTSASTSNRSCSRPSLWDGLARDLARLATSYSSPWSRR